MNNVCEHVTAVLLLNRQSSETSKAGCENPERSGSAERPDASSEGGEETAGIENGGANAGGADDQQVAEVGMGAGRR